MVYEIQSIINKSGRCRFKGIYEYIAFTLHEPETATNQLERIEEAILSLDEKPRRFRMFEKEPWYSRGLRQLPVDNFIIFYIPSIEDGIVTVIRVMYGGRDIDDQLNKTNQ
ncbi:type II toxin-antitoxin system RelE/ParE family toxin [Oceanobacillus caeni]|uniref:type II toxin-antitoxin system RelE/ParE family toxin n=1 Tax=Oceanobacillus caeni TaxID=405946 RepID=UPI001957EB44|nr:type II toxin-antitoxin system RelE/ParE family toxin [Oceanobacillus caeni]MBU8790549.1 type II toxin-antitoxin system RelE/ParE family toxin [Oceanobacillus caeni]